MRYLPDRATLSASVAEGGDRWRALFPSDGSVRFCANAAYDACNWLVPADSPDAFCRACRLNRTLPDLGVPANVLLWRLLEKAKLPLVYGLLRLGLPLVSQSDDLELGLAFDFLDGTGTGFREEAPAVTGHVRGLTTIDIAEADDAERERHRQSMAEPYRTLLDHIRHEVDHHHWDRLVWGGVWYHAFQEMFGDERRDYAASLEAHYSHGPQPGRQER